MQMDVRQLRRGRLGVALVSAVALGLLLWGRLLMQNVPQTAVAVPERAAATEDASQGKHPSGQNATAGKVTPDSGR